MNDVVKQMAQDCRNACANAEAIYDALEDMCRLPPRVRRVTCEAVEEICSIAQQQTRADPEDCAKRLREWRELLEKTDG
jgi:ketopantoate reductase